MTRSLGPALSTLPARPASCPTFLPPVLEERGAGGEGGRLSTKPGQQLLAALLDTVPYVMGSQEANPGLSAGRNLGEARLPPQPTTPDSRRDPVQRVVCRLPSTPEGCGKTSAAAWLST